MQIKAVDLFCGAGGLSFGLAQAGIEIVAGIDIDGICKFPYEQNCHAEFIQKDVATVRPNEIRSLLSGADVRLLAGCAPCQPFSSYAQGTRGRQSDERWQLLRSFVNIVEATLPELITMENVVGLRNHPIFAEFVRRLQSFGYNVHTTFLDGPRAGLGQTRKRLVVLGSRLGWPQINQPDALQKTPTVRQMIGSMPTVAAGCRDAKDFLHRASSLSDIQMRRIQASRQGGSWTEWPNELKAECHKKLKRPSYVSVYGRMEWDAPSPTITTQFYGIGHGRFGHPDQDRAITPREAAILQGFPKNYEFIKAESDFAFSTLGRMIGNAVPVPFGRLIGESAISHVRQEPSS